MAADEHPTTVSDDPLIDVPKVETDADHVTRIWIKYPNDKQCPGQPQDDSAKESTLNMKDSSDDVPTDVQNETDQITEEVTEL